MKRVGVLQAVGDLETQVSGVTLTLLSRVTLAAEGERVQHSPAKKHSKKPKKKKKLKN